MEHEAHGASLKELREKKRKEELHHLRVHARRGATAEKPGWVVAHHSSENDPEPKGYEFDDGNAMLAHIAEHAGVPDSQEEEKG